MSQQPIIIQKEDIKGSEQTLKTTNTKAEYKCQQKLIQRTDKKLKFVD